MRYGFFLEDGEAFPKAEDDAIKHALVDFENVDPSGENVFAAGLLIKDRRVPVIWREPDERLPGDLPAITVERMTVDPDWDKFLNERIVVDVGGKKVVKDAPTPMTLAYRVGVWAQNEDDIATMMLFVYRQLGGMRTQVLIRGNNRNLDYVGSLRVQFPEHKHRVIGVGLNYELQSYLEDDILQNKIAVERVEERVLNLYGTSALRDLTIPYDTTGEVDTDLLILFYQFNFDA